MNKVTPKTTEKAAPKKVFKISIEFYPGGTSRITRKDLPALIDKTDKSVAWLKAHDFKEEDIELLGTVPDCWETYYPAPVVEPAPLVEKIAEVLDAVVAEAVTEKDAEAIADIAAAKPIADPIVQALGIPEAEVTTLTDVFVPAPADAPVVPPEIVS